MSPFLSRPTAHKPQTADTSKGLTEQSPGPHVLAALASGAARANGSSPSRFATNARFKRVMRPKTGVSIEELARIARASGDVNGDATSASQQPAADEPHEYGADPMLWARYGEPRVAVLEDARPARPTEWRGWLMNLFF